MRRLEALCLLLIFVEVEGVLGKVANCRDPVSTLLVEGDVFELSKRIIKRVHPYPDAFGNLCQLLHFLSEGRALDLHFAEGELSRPIELVPLAGVFVLLLHFIRVNLDGFVPDRDNFREILLCEIGLTLKEDLTIFVPYFEVLHPLELLFRVPLELIEGRRCLVALLWCLEGVLKTYFICW